MTNSLPLVTVILLTYKKFDGIKETLESIFIQSYGNIELIIADDGSDNYFENEGKIKDIIATAKENITNVIIKHEDINVGTVKNCNRAISISHGKYIKFISPGDELFDCEVLDKLVSYAENKDSLIIIGQTFQKRANGFDKDIVKNTPFYRWSARGGRKALLIPSDIDIKKLQVMNNKDCLYVLMTKTIISTVSVFFSKTLLDETNGFVEQYRLIEDMTYWPSIAKKGIKFDFINLVVMKYSLNGISNRHDMHSNSPFELDRRDILKKYYIENMKTNSRINKCKKNLRIRELEALSISGVKKFFYIDVMFSKLFTKLKYFLTGSRL